jgi:hypothetical protein
MPVREIIVSLRGKDVWVQQIYVAPGLVDLSQHSGSEFLKYVSYPKHFAALPNRLSQELPYIKFSEPLDLLWAL